MAQDNYSGIPELSADAQAIARRKRIAEQMLQRSQTPMQVNRMAGQVVAPSSMTEGLAKLVQAYAGRKQLNQADQDAQGLADRRQKMVAEAMSAARSKAAGVPAVGPDGPQIPVEPDVRGAIQDSVASNFPEVQQYGQTMLGFENLDAKNEQIAATRDATTANQEANREQRMSELKMRLAQSDKQSQEANSLRAAIANLQAETSRDLASIRRSSGSGGGGRPIAVMGDDGKAVYVNPNDAVGMSPATKGNLKSSANQVDADAASDAVTSALDAEISNIDKIIGGETVNTATNKPYEKHPGMDAAVGSVDSLLPTVLQDTADAEALMDSLASKASISALREVKKSAGSIGQVTEREWPRLESMKATLQKSQGTDQYTQSLKDYRDELKRVKMRTKEAYTTDFGAPSVAPTTSDEYLKGLGM